MGCLRKIQVLFLIILAGMMLFAIPAFAQDEVRYYKPITEINLGVKELTLYVGEQYTFPMTYEPAETPAVFLDWYMDESTIQLDRETFTITAIAPGEARLMVESNMGFTFDYCDITVLGSQGKELVEKKAGTELIRLSEKDREKITAKSLMNFLEFVENSSFTPEAYAAVSERVFNVTAQVRPGSVSVESQRAAALGMEKALELPDLDAVSLRGTMSQILAFVSDNEDLHVLFEFEPFYIDDPAPDYNSDSAAKAMNLKDNVEAYTTVSKAHNLGYKGTGAVVAIIDTGFDKNHEQFSGRVIAEDCFASASGNYYPVCVSGSAAPSNSVSPSLHNHGSHVAGIAAGRDGIAPNAKLIGVGTAIEYCPTTDSCVDNMNFSLYEIAQYLVDLQRQYKSAGSAPIVAVNMSFGSTLESSVCDSKYESIYTRAFNLFVENNIIPVKSAGNSGADGSVSAPGCISSSFTVGALYDNSTPQIAPYSNHSETLVDILAPGTKIWSAFYAYDNSDYNWYTQSSCTNVSTNKNCYGYEGGTSMAAPMVTGAFAVLKQRYPNLTASQLEAQMIAMSTKTANYRLAGSEWSSNLTNPAKTFSYSKPILDFSRIDENPLISTDLTCGMNVKYVISGSTITFSKVNTSSAAVFGSDCVNAFKNNSGIKTVKINSAMSISSGSEFFSGCNYVTSMDLSKLNVSGVTSMYQMFYSCGSLTTLNVSGWNTSGVTTTKEMFMNCSSLKSLDLSSWNVSNVIEMWNMFYECSSLASLNVSSWNTSKVQDMDGLFYECSSLTSLDLSGWNTSSVEYKTYTFGYCDKLKTLSLGKNTLAVNIFEDLPAYNDIWYYVQKGSAAGSPVAVGTAKKDASLFTSYNYNTMAGTWSTTKPSELSTLTISQGSVLGYANGIEVKTAYDANATGYKISVYDVANKKTITPTIDKPVKSGSNVTIKIHGSSLVNGNIYKLTVYKYNTTNGKTTKSNTVTVYGMPHSVISKLTAQPISNGVRLDSEFKTGVDGTRYYVYDADTNKQVKKENLTGPATHIKLTGLENNKLYYAYARPYKIYSNQYVLGPKSKLVYFAPVAVPSGVKVQFSDATTAVISASANSTARGVRVLYRELGGGLKNGCVQAGNQCSIANLSQKKNYEFYVMHYNIINSVRHYGSGVSIQYTAPTVSDMARPGNAKIFAGNPTWTFSVTKSSDAVGISVLYRINEGDYQLCCEKAGTSCTKDLSKDQQYTFYIMQYKTVNGKKVYSPGITVKNLYGTKSLDGYDLSTEFVQADQTVNPEEIYDILEDYMTEEDMTGLEAFEMIEAEQSAENPEQFDIDFDEMDIEEELEEEVPAGFMASYEEADAYEPTEEEFIDVPMEESGEATAPKGLSSESGDESELNFYGIDDGSNSSEPYAPSFKNK